MNKLKCNVGEYGVVVNRRGELLILKLPNNKQFTSEAWMFPGGRLNTDDQAEIGLHREVLEETGLKIKVVSPVHVARWGAKYSVFFLCKVAGKQEVLISHEHTEYRWINFNEIEKISWHNINSKLAAKKSKNLLAKSL